MGSVTDLNDMSGNQQTFFGVHPINVQQQYNDTVNSVQVPDPGMGIDTSVNQGFVKDAPNLGFCLPFLPCNNPK